MLERFRGYMARHAVQRTVFVVLYIVLAVIAAPLWIYGYYCWVEPVKLRHGTKFLGPKEYWDDKYLTQNFQSDALVDRRIRYALLLGVSIPMIAGLLLLLSSEWLSAPWSYVAGAVMAAYALVVVVSWLNLTFLAEEISQMNLRFRAAKPQPTLF